MAMDFTEQPVQSRNNVFPLVWQFFLLLLLPVFLLTGCSSVPEKISASDPKISKKQGLYYYDGVLYSGVLRERDADGKLIHEMRLVNGERNGISTQYWPNGNIKREAVYRNGIYHGFVKTYYENGKPFESFNFVNGHESGRQQVWKSDGRIKANYEVINGRKYGLTGVKNCINVLEEEDHLF